jgi:DNA-binding SARP family transcriptional activator
MARLSIWLLGTFEVALEGQPVTAFAYDKVRALLAYLAVEANRPHRRESLTGLFWPDRPERNARQNLSQALSGLRHALGDHTAAPPFLLVTPQALQFNHLSDYRLDVTAFTTLLAACRAHSHARLLACQDCLARLQQAAALYRGSFLDGFSLNDSSAFEEWLGFNREHLHCLVMEALRWLAEAHTERGEYEAALPYAWREVELEPGWEESHQQLMRLLALSGQRSAALAHYDTCRRLLADELNQTPAAETMRLYEQIRDGKRP